MRNRSCAKQQGRFCYCNMETTIGHDTDGKEGGSDSPQSPAHPVNFVGIFREEIDVWKDNEKILSMLYGQ